MSFAVSADAYDLYMGRYSTRLAPQFADYAGVRSEQRVIDVGCGPGALTSELIDRLGPNNVFAIDKAFDAALAQLVVHFMSDPVAGLREMARVVREDGVVAACVWDHAGGEGPLSVFWRAARELDPDVEDQSRLAGTREGHLAELFVKAGLRGVKDTALAATVAHASFEEWWGPFTLGVGPAGAYTSRLDADGRAALMERCRELLPPAPFEVAARAWTARGLV